MGPCQEHNMDDQPSSSALRFKALLDAFNEGYASESSSLDSNEEDLSNSS